MEYRELMLGGELSLDRLIVLGTGNAIVTKCYNTCFALTNEKDYILVDAGGGNGILANLEKAQVPLEKIQNAFVSHKHTDHILGMVWVIRKVAYLIMSVQYEGNFNIYCHHELVHTMLTIIDATLDRGITDLIGKRINFFPVEDRQKKTINGFEFTFFDIHSQKTKQFGFRTILNNGKKLTFLGDEPFNSLCKQYVANSDWLLCEAFCLYRDREIFKPYEKHHSTVKEACELATELGIKNLVLWHTEDQDLAKRQELYTHEGKEYFKGNLYVPNDLDKIEL